MPIFDGINRTRIFKGRRAFVNIRNCVAKLKCVAVEEVENIYIFFGLNNKNVYFIF